MRTRRFATTAMVLGLAMAASTCARSTMLPDAYYAEHMVPIYPHARLTEQMGSNSTGDTPDESWDGMSWWFETKDDYDRIVAFYQAKLPGWQKETDADGTVVFKTIPEGAETGEEVYVRIGVDSKIQIGESVQSKKKAAAHHQS